MSVEWRTTQDHRLGLLSQSRFELMNIKQQRPDMRVGFCDVVVGPLT